jgi:hypothetical protein
MSLQIEIISSKNLYNQQMEEYIIDLLGPFWKVLIDTCDQLKTCQNLPHGTLHEYSENWIKKYNFNLGLHGLGLANMAPSPNHMAPRSKPWHDIIR